MSRVLCYLRHRPFRIVVESVGFPWPVEWLDPNFDWHCARCDKGGHRPRNRVRRLTALPFPA